MAKKTSKRKVFKPRKVSLNCVFCKSGINPSYKEYETLAKFITDRAKILAKDRTGVCTKHQRKIASEVKRARHLALLPFTPTI